MNTLINLLTFICILWSLQIGIKIWETVGAMKALRQVRNNPLLTGKAFENEPRMFHCETCNKDVPGNEVIARDLEDPGDPIALPKTVFVHLECDGEVYPILGKKKKQLND